MHEHITRLEHFAAAALTGLLANPSFHEQEILSRTEPDRDIIKLAVKKAIVLDEELRAVSRKESSP